MVSHWSGLRNFLFSRGKLNDRSRFDNLSNLLSPFFPTAKSFEKRVAEVSDFDGDFDGPFDGVVCGHMHSPLHKRLGTLDYFNCGDWLIHRSAVIDSGSELELISFDPKQNWRGLD